ncbi:unnamed protein product [Lactuca saligna]|uniref:CCR4-NOT transcription complex subunit 9 n=1 Tax=Lactuca saligna TaxID=75948 RepID=A0AA36EFP3_LACSI|nr:unnamed protein product [Lactuca saligna]
MENLPESLYVDPTGGSSSNSAPKNTARPQPQPQQFSATDRAEIQQLINLLNHPQTRAEAITQLNRVYTRHKAKGGRELGLLLWNSKYTIFSLLEELLGVYKLLSPPKLGMAEATRVCNALALLQCIATHPDTRLDLLKAHIPVYIYPFLNTTEKQLVHYDYLRVNSLGVIGALLKEQCPKTDEIVHYLLQSEMVPLCLRCMDVGSDLTKSVAAFVIGKILGEPEGKTYCGTFAERFFSVSRALSKMVDEFSGKPSPALLKNTLICYLRLSEISRCCNVLKKRYPERLRNPVYLNHVCDGNTRALAEQVLQNIM